MSLRYTHSRFTNSSTASGILKCEGGAAAFPSLDASQCTGTEGLPLSTNSKSFTYGGKPTFGTDIIDVLPNRLYLGYSGAASGSASGTYSFGSNFWSTAQNGDMVGIVVHNGDYINIVNASHVNNSTSGANNPMMITAREMITNSALAYPPQKGGVFFFRTYVYPITSQKIVVPAFFLNAMEGLDDIDVFQDFTPAINNFAPRFRYNPITQKWEIRPCHYSKTLVITNANIADYISYDRFFDTGVRETDGFYFRFSQQANSVFLNQDFDSLYIVWQADTMVVNGVSTSITNAKIVLPNVTNYWTSKLVTILLDTLNCTLDLTLEKDAALVDNTCFIESANWTTTPPLDGTIKNFKLDANTYQVWSTGIKLTAIGLNDIVPNLPDEVGTQKSWIII